MAAASDVGDEIEMEIELDELLRETDTSYLDAANTILLAVATSNFNPRAVLGTVRINDYVEVTVPAYSDPLFKAHFCMSRSTVQVRNYKT
jgi:hypothetical protein